MGAFDYKNYTIDQSVALAELSFRLASQSVLQTKVAGISIDQALTGLQGTLGVGAISGGPMPLDLPEGWRDLSAATIGLQGARIDESGFIKMESPITGWADGGPQVKVYGEYGADGSLDRVCISFVATNNLIDVADYFALNNDVLTACMVPLLDALAAYMTSQGLSGDDVLVTGYSLGGGLTNLMARGADTLAGGFYADADFVGHEAPVVVTDGSVLNIGYENDVVHRLTGEARSFDEAVDQAGPGLSNPDGDYHGSNDNMVIFDGNYAAAGLSLAVDSLLNPFGWWAHVGAVLSDAVARIGNSAFYDLTNEDSAIVVSNLGADLRGTVWVEDKSAPTSDHYGDPGFIVGTSFADKLRDGQANDYLDGGAGSDVIRTGSGMNVVEGGSGNDTLRVLTTAAGASAYRLADGTLVVATADGLTLARGIEDVELSHYGPLGVVEHVTDYSIQSDRLEDDHWSAFELGDRDIRFGRAVEGGANVDTLSGRAVFGQGGNDRVSGTTANDLLHGGRGQDVLTAGAGGDRLYGAEDADRLVAGAGGTLNGGHGNDVFVFTPQATGTVTVEDFNLAAHEADRISLTQFRDFAGVMAAARQVGDAVDIRAGGLTIHIEDTRLADLSADDFLFV